MCFVNVVLFSYVLVEIKLFPELVYAISQLRDCLYNPSYLRMYNIRDIFKHFSTTGIQ